MCIRDSARTAPADWGGAWTPLALLLNACMYFCNCSAGEATCNHDGMLLNTPGERVFLPAGVLAAADGPRCRVARLSHGDAQSTVPASGRSATKTWMVGIPKAVSKSRLNKTAQNNLETYMPPRSTWSGSTNHRHSAFYLPHSARRNSANYPQPGGGGSFVGRI